MPEETFDFRMSVLESVVLTDETDGVLVGKPDCGSDEGSNNSGGM
mgnify:CR=1 FL=1